MTQTGKNDDLLSSSVAFLTGPHYSDVSLRPRPCNYFSEHNCGHCNDVQNWWKCYILCLLRAVPLTPVTGAFGSLCTLGKEDGVQLSEGRGAAIRRAAGRR